MTSSVPLQQIPVTETLRRARLPLNIPVTPDPNPLPTSIQPNMGLSVGSQLPTNAPNGPLSSPNTMQQAPKPTANSTWNTTGTTATAFSKVPLKDADDEPFRYRGYPATTAWMASDDDFFVIRRFGRTSARVILLMQHRIAQLEENLLEEDVQCMHDGGDNGTFEGDYRWRRREIMDELSWRLERYQRFVLDHSELKARQNATDRQISNVKNFFENSNYPLRPAEMSFIKKDGDLIPLVPRVKPPLRRFIDRFDIASWWQLGASKLNRSHYNHPENFESTTTIYSEERSIDKFVTCVTIALGLAMLIAPLWLLRYVYAQGPDLTKRLWVITAFICAFTGVLSFVAVAKPFEVVAATAAYGAVLMVFVQIGTP